VQVDRLVRGLVVQAVPRYTRSSSTEGNAIDVDAVSLTLQARYEITRYVAAIAGYTFFMQRSNSAVVTGGGIVTAGDVDQNRVFVGLQFGYPITID
jgi:long-subunit fatty acid transport protein